MYLPCESFIGFVSKSDVPAPLKTGIAPGKEGLPSRRVMLGFKPLASVGLTKKQK